MTKIGNILKMPCILINSDCHIKINVNVSIICHSNKWFQNYTVVSRIKS